MTSARRYRLLLRAYPPAYRVGRGDEIVDTYLELASTRVGAGRWRRLRLGLSDAVDLLAAGIRERLRARGATGVVDALPLAAVFSMGAAAGLAAIWLVGVEPRPTGPQTLGAVVWIGWLLAALGAVALPARVTRRLAGGAVALGVLVVPVAAITPLERPPLLVLVPQVALGLLALGWPQHASGPARTGVVLAPLAAGAAALAAGGDPDGYRTAGPGVLLAAAVALVAAAVMTALARTAHRDARGWWAVLLVLPPAALLVVEPIVLVIGDTTGLTVLNLPSRLTLAAAAVVLPLLAVTPIPAATFLRNRWRATDPRTPNPGAR